MSLFPSDLVTIVRNDLVVADVLLTRLSNQQGSRELLAAELVQSLSVHIAASEMVLLPALLEHLEASGAGSALSDDNRLVAEALDVIQSTSGPDADIATTALHVIVQRSLESLDADPSSAAPSAAAADTGWPTYLRAVVGDAGMVDLGREFVMAKRHSPSRPHPNSNSASFRLVSVIDRLKDMSSGRAVLAATDGSGILNDESQEVVNALAELAPKPIETLEPEQARRQPAVVDAVNRVLERVDEDVVPEPLARVEDTLLSTATGDVTVRIYDAQPDPDRLRPVVVFVHGGGWVIGDIFASDPSARGLALLIDALVVSVEYRRAPEHSFPAAHDDVLAAVRFLQLHADQVGGDPERIAMVGEGAGANMVAATALGLIRSDQPLPSAQVLVCPITSMSAEWPSFRDNADAKPLNTAMVHWFVDHLLAGTEADDRLDLEGTPDADLARMPPTLVITAERDPLHDQGVAFAERLKRLGVVAAVRDYPGVPHDFFGMARVSADARDAQLAAATLVTSAFTEAARPAEGDVRNRP